MCNDVNKIYHGIEFIYGNKVETKIKLCFILIIIIEILMFQGC
jgi:hypothetical protein